MRFQCIELNIFCIAHLLFLNIQSEFLHATTISEPPYPQLIVLISVDQMRGDFLKRWENFWQGGFSTLLQKGIVFDNCYYEHYTNMTGPGHAIIATGTYPNKNSITHNYIYSSKSSSFYYCVEDSLATEKGDYLFSPNFLKVPTIGDLLKEQFPKSRVVSIAHKDRAAILLGGKKANTVLWFDAKKLTWTSSPYYGKEPNWIKDFNKLYPVARWSNWVWQSRLPTNAYFTADDVSWEGEFPGGDRRFPHQIPALKDTGLFRSAYLCSPAAIEDLFALAETSIRREKLGQRQTPDLLCISISATDYAGHIFGPESNEIAELYIHLDGKLQQFIEFLDSHFSHYLLVLTSDHGVSPVPEYLKKMKIHAGRIDIEEFQNSIEQKLRQAYPHLGNHTELSVFFPPYLSVRVPSPDNNDCKNFEGICDSIIHWGKQFPGIWMVIPISKIHDDTVLTETQRIWLVRDYYPNHVGDFFIITEPYWIWGKKTTTHGTWYEYDRYVPLIFYSSNLQPKRSMQRCEPVDIVPTILSLMNLPIPEWIDGKPLLGKEDTVSDKQR